MTAPAFHLIARYAEETCDVSVKKEVDVAHFKYVAQVWGGRPGAAGMLPNRRRLVMTVQTIIGRQ